jgi:hypothetical protein
LFKAIKVLTYQSEGRKYHVTALHLAKKRFYMLYQGHESTHAQYLQNFQKCVAIVEQYGGNIGRDTGAVKSDLEATIITDFAGVSVKSKLAAMHTANEKSLAVAFLSSGAKVGFWKLLEYLEND